MCVCAFAGFSNKALLVEETLCVCGEVVFGWSGDAFSSLEREAEIREKGKVSVSEHTLLYFSGFCSAAAKQRSTLRGNVSLDFRPRSPDCRRAQLCPFSLRTF